MEKVSVYRKAGWIISALCAVFLFADAVTKIIKAAPAVKGSVEIGWPVEKIVAIGMVLLVITVLYLIPRTSFLGAILLTGYLGGATSVMMRAALEGHPYFFPVVFGLLIWVGLYMREDRLRSLIQMKKAEPQGSPYSF